MSIRNSSLDFRPFDRHRFAQRLVGNLRTGEAIRRILIWLGVFQSIIILAAAVLAKIVYIELLVGPHPSLLPYVVPAVLLAVMFHVLSVLLKLQQIDVLVGPRLGFCAVLGALALSFLVLLGGMYLLKLAEYYSRGWFLTWFVISAMGLVALRWYAVSFLKVLFEAKQLSRYFAVYGTADYVSELTARIESTVPFAEVTGAFVERDLPKNGHELTPALAELERAVASGAFEKVVVGLPESRLENIRAATRVLAPYTSELMLCMRLDPLPLPIHSSYAIGNLHALVLSPVPEAEKHFVSKRIFDCAVAGIGLLALTPVLILAALAIKLDSRGPVFFRQRRYGRNNEVFRIFKFRTMSVTEDGAKVEQARVNDPRITRVGRILRATSIDELPQLINVLLGHMSIVGPRPHALAHELQFEQEFDQFSRRRRVLPGITGWAQVNGCRGETRTAKQVRDRMEYDLYYIDNWSIWFDIDIIARTFVTITRGAV